MVTPWGKNIRCGIRTYSENLIGALADEGVDVYVIRFPRFGKKTPEILANVAESIPVDKVDLIHVQEEYGLFQTLDNVFYDCLKKLGKPVVSTMHAVGNIEVDHVVAEVSSCVIVHNKFCFRKFGFPQKTVIVPHGCSLVQCLPKEECKKKLGVDDRIPLVGYVGFISRYKGLEVLIEAMRRIRAALLIGGGWHVEAETRYITELKEFSLKTLPGRCQWIGYVPDERLPIVYGSLSCLVYPSVYATESGALLMGLSHGRATITSAVPPFKEKEKQGALMTFKSVKDLTRKIKRLLKDEELRRKLEEGAKAYARKNSWENIAQQHIRLYKDVIQSGAS